MRFGHDKAQETIGATSLLERVLFQLGFLNSEILVVTAQEIPHLYRSGQPGFKVASDIYPGKGPLGGIYTGLKLSGSFYNLVVACDMPFLNRGLLQYMFGVMAGYDLVVPRLGDLIEPLHAIYSRACLTPVENLLRKNILSIRELFRLVRVRYVEKGEIDRFDPAHVSFFNVNTRSDLARAKEIEGVA